jgi:hypothetical protein
LAQASRGGRTEFLFSPGSQNIQITENQPANDGFIT